MKNQKVLEKVVLFFLLLGGLNWGLIGVFEWNLIAAIFGMMSAITRIIYVLIGLSFVYRFVCWARCQGQGRKK